MRASLSFFGIEMGEGGGLKDKVKQDKTRQSKARDHKTRQHEARHDKTGQGKTEQDMSLFLIIIISSIILTRQDKRQDKTRQAFIFWDRDGGGG